MSQRLDLLQTVQSVMRSTGRADCRLHEYDDLFNGLGKLKNYQVQLHIDVNVPPIAQPHRRVPFHVRKQLEEQLRQDEELGVIERVESPRRGCLLWWSPPNQSNRAKFVFVSTCATTSPPPLTR